LLVPSAEQATTPTGLATIMAMRAADSLYRRVYRAPSPIHGTGCFARIGFASGDYIGNYAGRPAKRDGTYVLWVLEEGKAPVGRSGRNLLRWVNHQIPGNARFDGFDLYARQAIAPGEEITFDYGGGDGAERPALTYPAEPTAVSEH
jgi:uncharacterized protein